jgi:hypothetical protein
MGRMICKTPRGRKAGCVYGNHCCPSAEHCAGHKRKRRAIKRSERQAVQRMIRDGKDV